MKHLKTLLPPAIAAVATFMISSCDPKPAKGTSLDNVPNILTNVVGDSISQTWAKDSISVTSDFGHVGIAMQHPVDTFSVTSQAITEYMSEMLGGKYDGSYTSPKAVMKYYHADLMSELKTEYEEVKTGKRRRRSEDGVGCHLFKGCRQLQVLHLRIYHVQLSWWCSWHECPRGRNLPQERYAPNGVGDSSQLC